MKKSKRIFSSLVLVAVMAITIMPSSSVYADGSGPQGGSNSGGPPPPPPPPPSNPPGGGLGLGWGWICNLFGGGIT